MIGCGRHHHAVDVLAVLADVEIWREGDDEDDVEGDEHCWWWSARAAPGWRATDCDFRLSKNSRTSDDWTEEEVGLDDECCCFALEFVAVEDG